LTSREIKQALEDEKQQLIDKKSRGGELSPSEKVKITEIDENIALNDHNLREYEKLSKLFTKKEAWVDTSAGKKRPEKKRKKPRKKSGRVAPEGGSSKPSKKN